MSRYPQGETPTPFHYHGIKDIPTGWGEGKVPLSSELESPVGADHVGYDNATSGLPADTVQEAIDAIVGGGVTPSGPASGDLSGTYPAPLVVGFNGIPIDTGTPNNGDALLYNNLTNEWEHAPIVFAGGPPTGPAGGDLGGIYPNPGVVGLQTRPVSNAAPAVGAALVWNGVQWAPASAGLVGAYTVTPVVANYNAAPWEVILANTSGGGFTVTLPLAATCAGKPITIKKVSSDGNVLVVDAQGAETIDGAPNLSITAQYASPTLLSDGANWWII